MTTVNANMSAEQFFWKKIDRDGSGSIESIFELNEAERRGFSAKIGMTAEEFIKTNKKAIQKKANTDFEYSQYQFEEAKKQQESKQKILKEKLSKVKEEVSKLGGKKPTMGIDTLNGNTEKAKESLNSADKLLEDVASGAVEVTVKEQKSDDRTMKTAHLSDGRWIMACYDKDGKIDRIYVSTDGSDTGNVELKADYAGVATTNDQNAGYDTKLTKGYEFEKYCQLAEKIFGNES